MSSFVSETDPPLETKDLETEESEIETTISERIGALLLRARVAQKLSQEELARRSGVSRFYISSIEQGKRNMTVGLLRRLTKELNVAAWEIMQEAETTN